MDIGKTIRKSREKLGLSQKDLAKADHRRPRSGVDRALTFFVISRKRQKNPGHVRKTVRNT